MTGESLILELTEEELILITKLREDRLLRKAVFRYFEALSGIKLNQKS